MDSTSKKLIQLLDSSDLELRMSAIRTIGEIGLVSKEVIHTLARCLREDHEPLRILALKALARLGARDVLDLVVPLVLESGSLREYALQVVAAVGHPAVSRLFALYGKANFHGKSSVATALSQISGKQAVEFLLRILPGEPFELQKHITHCICESLDGLQPQTQQPLYKPVLRHLSSKKAQSELQLLVAGLIILGHFRGEHLVRSARQVLLRYADKRYSGEVRRHALVSFQRLLGEGPPGPDQIHSLYKLLCDEDWHNVAQHALSAFQRVELPRQHLLKLVNLLHASPHFSVHIHVFERLRGQDSREVARAIIPFLSDNRFRVRDAAEAALRSIPSAIEDLFKALMEIEDSEVCQRITSILREYPQEAKRRFAEEATKLFLALFDQNDGRYQFFFDFVQAIDAEPIRARIYQKVRSLKASRSKEKWIKIAGYLQILWDHHLITPDGRYLFAVALIHQSNKDLSPPARRANLGLRVLRALIYDNTPGLVDSLTKDRDVGPEDLFYIGFHFMEEGEELRPFAKTLLEFLLRKYPKSKVAGAARAKLDLHVVQPAPPVASAPPPRRASEKSPAAAPARVPSKGPVGPTAPQKPQAPQKARAAEKPAPAKAAPKKKTSPAPKSPQKKEKARAAAAGRPPAAKGKPSKGRKAKRLPPKKGKR